MKNRLIKLILPFLLSATSLSGCAIKDDTSSYLSSSETSSNSEISSSESSSDSSEETSSSEFDSSIESSSDFESSSNSESSSSESSSESSSSESSSSEESSIESSSEVSSSEASSSESSSSESSSSESSSSSEESSSSESSEESSSEESSSESSSEESSLESSSESASSEESSESTSSSDDQTKETYPTTVYGNYYGNLTWTNKDDLVSKLYTLLRKDFNSLKYEGNWETNQAADQSFYDFECVDVVYNSIDELITDTNSGSSGWQREHAFAASLMTGYTSGYAVTAGSGRATDFHNLFAAYATGNMSRSNKNFGNTDPSKEGYTNPTDDGIDYSYDTLNFEPSDTDKGKLARAIFYMGVMYSQTETTTVKVKNGNSTVSLNVTYKPLRVVDEYVNYAKEYTYSEWVTTTPSTELSKLIETYGEGATGYVKYSDANCEYAIGNKQDFLSWSKEFGVSSSEYQHNEKVYSTVYSGYNKAQNNRNPFVDYPDLVDYVYGDKQNQSGQLKYLKPTCIALDEKGEDIDHYAIQSAKRTYLEGETISASDFSIVEIKKDGTEGNIYTPDFTSYTFAESDVTAGKKNITIKTPINTLSFVVKVKAAGIENCLYKYTFTGIAKGNDLYEIKDAPGEDHKLSLNGVDWIMNFDKGKIYNSNDDGPSFGTSSYPIGTLTLKTDKTFSYQDKTKIKSVYIAANAASGATVTLEIYIGQLLVKEATISYSQDGAKEYGIELDEPITGIVTYKITNTLKKAFRIKSIGVDAIE